MEKNILFFESELSMPFGMVKLALRSTVIKTSKGVIVISPIRFNKHQIKEIHELGEVVALVEPSLIHHLYLGEAIEHFPDAKVWGPVDCRKKCPEYHWDKILGKDKWPYRDELDMATIKGMPRINEAAFYDKATQTLILGDFCFNLLHPRGWAAPFMLRALGIYKKFSMSRFFTFFINDAPLFKKSVQKIMQWDFDHVVVAHGEIVSAGGRAKILAALEERGFSLQGPKAIAFPHTMSERLAA